MVSPQEGGTDDTKIEPEWTELIARGMKHCRTTFDETLAWPLLRLNAILAPLEKMAAEEAMAGMMANPLGMLGAAAPSGEPSAKQSVKPKGGTSLLGETPQFETREEYLAYLSDKGIT